MVEFSSELDYVESCTTMKAKIVAIDAIIDKLLVTSLRSVGNDDISEYWLDDGQTKIKTIYRSSTQASSAINIFERIKQRYVNRLNGRSVRLMDSQSFNGNPSNR